jgi:hypothetical protein
MLDAVELVDDLTSSAFLDIASALRAFQQITLTRMKSAIAETLASRIRPSRRIHRPVFWRSAALRLSLGHGGCRTAKTDRDVA